MRPARGGPLTSRHTNPLPPDSARCQLEEEGGQIYELNRALQAEKSRSLDLARNGQEARLLLAQHEETVAVLRARLQVRVLARLEMPHPPLDRLTSRHTNHPRVIRCVF